MQREQRSFSTELSMQPYLAGNGDTLNGMQGVSVSWPLSSLLRHNTYNLHLWEERFVLVPILCFIPCMLSELQAEATLWKGLGFRCRRVTYLTAAWKQSAEGSGREERNLSKSRPQGLCLLAKSCFLTIHLALKLSVDKFAHEYSNPNDPIASLKPFL